MFLHFFDVLCCAWGKDFLPFDFLLKRNQPRSVGVRGRETSAFEMVLSPEAKQNKLMAALRWFLPRESS